MIPRYRFPDGVTALLRGALAALIVASPAWAQTHQPWTGRGVQASQVQPADSAPPARSAATAGARAVTMVGLTVSDMERSVEFYTHVLELREDVGSRGGRSCVRGCSTACRAPGSGSCASAWARSTSS